jgi:chemotaxis protein methyltransferase WspC
MRNLERLLAQKGLIFVGHAETTQISQSLFESVRHPLTFAYRKKDNENNELKDLDKSNSRDKQLEASQKSSSRLDLKTSGVQRQSARIFEKSKTFTAQDVLGEKQGLTKYSPEIAKSDKTPNSAQLSTKNLLREEQSVTKSLRERTKSDQTQNSAQLSTLNLETIRRLADGGNLSEAAKLGETYLKENCTSVEAYVLLGQVYQAKGLEKQAEQCFQKAIYLEPNHYDALLHLALLKEQCGDVAKASVLRQRIQRLQKL